MPACGRRSSSDLSTLKVHAGLSPVKLQWVKLDAVKLIKEGPPEGKEHRHPEMYYEGVLPGAHLIADECSKDVIFESNLLVLSCVYENLFHMRYATLV